MATKYEYLNPWFVEAKVEGDKSMVEISVINRNTGEIQLVRLGVDAISMLSQLVMYTGDRAFPNLDRLELFVDAELDEVGAGDE